MTIPTEIDCGCGDFREALFHFQAEEVPEPERLRLQRHLDRCPDCARRLELENSFLRYLRGHFRREAAPADLRARIRTELARRAPARRWARIWRGQGAMPLAAALMLAMLLAPALVDWSAGLTAGVGGPSVRVTRTVTVVDLECERGGATPEQQRGCRHAGHFNALKVADNAYWNLSLAQDRARALAFDPGRRGERIVVEGDLYPALGTIHLSAVRAAGSVPL